MQNSFDVIHFFYLDLVFFGTLNNAVLLAVVLHGEQNALQIVAYYWA